MEIDKVKSMKTAQSANWLNVQKFCGPCHDKKSEQVGNSASTQPQGYAFILIAMCHQCHHNLDSNHHVTKIGVMTNKQINHLLEAAQRANSSTCKMLSNKVLNNNAIFFDNFVDQSTLIFQLIVAFSITFQSLSCNAFRMVACNHLCFTKVPSGNFNDGFQLVVEFNKVIELIKNFGHIKLIKLFMIFGHIELIKLIKFFGHNEIIERPISSFKLIVDSEGAQFAPTTLQVQACNHQTDFQQAASHFNEGPLLQMDYFPGQYYLPSKNHASK
jgi:hypothetical protein